VSKVDYDRQRWLAEQAGKVKAVRPAPEQRDELHSRKPTSREGRVILSAWVKPAAARQFKNLAFTSSKTNQALTEEAMNLVFRKYNLPEIA
jgi:hypothetical protein